MADTTLFRINNILTAAISLLTAMYLLPFVPHLLDGTDKLYLEATTSRRLIENIYPPTVRERLIKRDIVEGGECRDSEEISDDHHEGRREIKKMKGAISSMQDFIRRRRSRASLTELKGEEFDSAAPIADDFKETSIMFADISNFTYWCSQHSALEVFRLLESIYFQFDKIAAEMNVFKLSTVGDCYIATTGVPFPRDDHAVVLAEFAQRCLKRGNQVLRELEKEHDMDGLQELDLRIGLHSGPCIAGILRGDKARFDVFGDTINRAARVEATGEPGRVHVSKETAKLLEKANMSDWLIPRGTMVEAKGLGQLETFWLKVPNDDGYESPIDISSPTELSEDCVEMVGRENILKKRMSADIALPMV